MRASLSAITHRLRVWHWGSAKPSGRLLIAKNRTTN